MKKLLAICLSVFMVISLMPAVFAANPGAVTISAAEPTWIEGESYTTGIQTKKGTNGTFSDLSVTASTHIKSDAAYHGGKVMNRFISYSSGGAGSVVYLEIPVTVAAEGDYKITLSAPQTENQYTRLYAGDASGNYTQVLLTTRAGAAGSNKVPTFYDSIGYAHLTTDITKLKFEATMTANGYLMYSWDYIKLEPVSAPVTVSGTTRIEAENYPIFVTSVEGATDFKDNTYQNMIVNDESLSGEAYISRGVKTSKDSFHTSYIEIPFNVDEDGTYTIKVNLKHYKSQSQYTFSLDGGTETAITSSLTETGWEEATFANKIEAGTHTIKINSQPHSGTYYYLDIDYVEIEMLPSKFDVGNAAPTTIQAENYPVITCVRSDDTTHMVTGTVADGVLTADCAEHEDANGTNSWNITLDVDTTGVYEIKTVAGGALTDANGGVEIKLDDEVIITDAPDAEDSTDTVEASADKKTFVKRVYLAAGERLYSYTAKSINGKATVTIDYVEITPVVAGSADPDTTGTPVISAPAEFLTGAPVTVTYTYAAGNTNPEGESILRVIYEKDSVWEIGSTTTVTGGTGSIVLPDNLAGYKVGIEFIPVDSEGLMGPLTSIIFDGILARAIAIDMEDEPITSSGSNFSATVTITNNSATSHPQNICVILVQYDADGAMLAVTNATVSVENGTPQTLTPSFAKETGAAKVQMFIWDGTGYSDAGASTYGSAVTYMIP